LEVDVTNLVNWRNENKDKFLEKYGEKLTFTPIFIDAVAKAIQDFPLINVSVDENKIIVHKDINIGMATALPTGNLIVSVVKNANEKDIISIAKEVNQLAESARNNKLKPEDIQGSTFTISNVGTFGSLMGTPIINQPEVAILALGIIKKRPEVITTEKGDEIAIRSMMFLSLSFDHRVVDGFLGGSFLKRVGDNLEQFNTNIKI
jgi:2-oxoglutarate dehydrogenase E2 component (dihydrolipoamide succinyltransferase)